MDERSRRRRSQEALVTGPDRRAAYASLWLLALAFGWIEGSVVVYLREMAARAGGVQVAGALSSVQALESLAGGLVPVEMAREACTMVLLGAVGWLAGRANADRIGAFLLTFGIWDITYYAVLHLVSGWPQSITTWDVLFLIPSPWVAPVWAPVADATLFVIAGSYLFWTPDRDRRYRWIDVGVLLIAVGLTLVAFLAGSTTAIEHQLPDRFPVGLFWSGFILGGAGFVAAERRRGGRLVPH
jgi:hypothetical protein